MNLRILGLYCSLQFAFGQFTTEFKLNENCRDFIPPSSYPMARRNENVVEKHHGVTIADPYRWLEDPYSDETKQIISAQNELCDSYLKNCDVWQKIHEKLTETYNYKKYTLPQYHGDHYYFQMNTGLQNQNVYYKTKSLDDEPSVFLDPNEMSADGTIAINSFSFSNDAKIVAYTFSKSGATWNKLKIRQVKTGEDYPEILEGLKFTQAAWTSDNRGFFYSRFLKVGDVTETDKLENQKIYYHRIGEPQENDILVFEFPNQPASLLHTTVIGKYVFVLLWVNQYNLQNHIYFAELEKNGEINGKITLTPIFNADANSAFDLVTMMDSKVVYQTNRGAPNYRLIMIDLKNPAEENWTTLIEEDRHDVLLQAAQVDGNKILTVYLRDVRSILKIFSLDTGKLMQELPLEMESVAGISLGKTQSEVFIQFASFLSPGSIYRYNFADPLAEPILFYEMKPNSTGFDKKNFDVEQLFYPSSDGTIIPMFLVQKLTTKNKPGPKPILLHGYGGYEMAILPTFKLDWFHFVNSFGILAVANIRGGGEYGKRWHDAGKLFKKQNSYDDFHAAAEYLIEHQYTTRDELVIRGESNGGLLIGVCINQRPDLYKAAVAQVGTYDMIRFPLFGHPAAMFSELGDPDKRSKFENLLKFSPLHNIHTPNSTLNQYPATLITTADHDGAVVPLHSLKFTATLQHAVQGNKFQKNPILMKLVKDAGHGDGKPTYKLIDQESDILTFLYRALGIEIDL